MILIRTPRQFGVEALGTLGIMLLAAGGLSAHAAGNGEETASAKPEAGPGNYTVIDGKVDQGTYDGYIAYTRSCMACHGPDGLGSSFAPSLIQAAERRNFGEFSNTIVSGLELQPGRVMPSFADDEYVLSNIENIYSYMKARGAGDLDRGRPRVIEEEADEEEQDEEEQDEEETQTSNEEQD
ncbi:c-type cytochrome [Halomonas rhizosphaerae]|uniref:Cytochrome c n=1 Tax=Halomonas rhizosphaerae TaxID=3043296 RepID=A0ABT6UWC1_9GAMM|nr:cytochrome c [Halomonas rhizosphaerae]MDI5890264.1 cytochrome c [Halomonas rhizosphaerae]MDI5920782.1 cytochrome c [Halomonas rhizosphaerae]